MPPRDTRLGDFLTFYREYARSGVHAASTAALTAFGLLMRFHDLFAALAILAYLLPLAYQYNHWDGGQHTGEVETEVRENDTSPEADVSVGVDDSGPSVESGDSYGSTDATDTNEQNDAKGRTWECVGTPTDLDLFDVVAGGVGGSDAYVAGADGVLLEWADGAWTTVLSDGPGMAGNTLRGIDATADGRAVWVAGDGGAVGRYDTGRERHTDHSAPAGNTDTWTDIAVVGPGGSESVFLANGSGAVLRGRYDGETVQWGSPVKPGSGSSLAAVAAVGVDRTADRTDDTRSATSRRPAVYAVDTNGGVFWSDGTDDGWEQLGIDGAGALTGVGSAGSTELVVTAADGTLYRYDGAVWTPAARADAALRSVAVARVDENAKDDEDAVAVGDEGAVLERRGGGWTVQSPVVSDALSAVCLTADHALAVGESGTALERRRSPVATDESP